MKVNPSPRKDPTPLPGKFQCDLDRWNIDDDDDEVHTNKRVKVIHEVFKPEIRNEKAKSLKSQYAYHDGKSYILSFSHVYQSLSLLYRYSYRYLNVFPVVIYLAFPTCVISHLMFTSKSFCDTVDGWESDTKSDVSRTEHSDGPPATNDAMLYNQHFKETRKNFEVIQSLLAPQSRNRSHYDKKFDKGKTKKVKDKNKKKQPLNFRNKADQFISNRKSSRQN